ERPARALLWIRGRAVDRGLRRTRGAPPRSDRVPSGRRPFGLPALLGAGRRVLAGAAGAPRAREALGGPAGPRHGRVLGGPRRLASPIEIFPAPSGPGVPGSVSFEEKPYRGSLLVLTNPRGTLNVVDRLDLDEYLYGVVPAEMGPKRYDEIEALKAQAVAAR